LTSWLELCRHEEVIATAKEGAGHRLATQQSRGRESVKKRESLTEIPLVPEKNRHTDILPPFDLNEKGGWRGGLREFSSVGKDYR